MFNNAGMSFVATIAETTDDMWERQLQVNLSGSLYVRRAAVRHMAQRRSGSIVNTGSELALVGPGGYTAYSATKAVCPGAIDTPLLAAEFALSPDPEAEREENERSIALGRIGQPQEIAQAALFLLSDEASYITGAQLLVDGGRVGCFPVGSIARSAG